MASDCLRITLRQASSAVFVGQQQPVDQVTASSDPNVVEFRGAEEEERMARVRKQQPRSCLGGQASVADHDGPFTSRKSGSRKKEAAAGAAAAAAPAAGPRR